MGVAFEEIPQRELRVGMAFTLTGYFINNVAFEEIPQRELRAGVVASGLERAFLKVAFEEIPQRELRVVLDIEAVGMLVAEEVLHSKKSHKGN